MADMDIAQRGDIAEEAVYMLLKTLWLNVASPSKNSDDRGIDFMAEHGEFDLKIQVKSVKRTKIRSNDGWISYDLSAKNNNILYEYSVGKNEFRKWILVLVVVPDNEEELLFLSEEELTMKCQVFRNKQFEPTDNETTCVINIPKQQQINLENQDLSSVLATWVA